MKKRQLDYIADRIEGHRGIHPRANREEFYNLIAEIVRLHHLTLNGDNNAQTNR